MKKALITYFTLLLSFTLMAGPAMDSVSVIKKIDSLETLIYNALNYDLSVSEKISICNQLTLLYEYKSPKKQVEFASRSLVLAEEMGDNDQINYSLNMLSSAYLKMDKYEKAIEYATRLFSIYKNTTNEIEEGKALAQIGLCYFGWSKYIEAKDYYVRALDIFKKNQYFEGVASTLSKLATILGNWGEYDEALSYNQEALKFWEEIGNDEGIASSYNNIGTIYEELGNYERAFEFYHKSLELYKKTNVTSNIVGLTLHIGDIYLRKGLYDKALEYYFKAEFIGKQINNVKLKSITLSNIGEAYNLRGDYMKALDYQEQALALIEEIGDNRRLSITYTELGIVYKNVEDYDKALHFLRKGLEVAGQINFKYQLNKCYFNLSDVYDQLGDYKNSIDYFKLYIEGKEKIYSEESKQTIAELQAKYQVEKKDKENERLRHGDQLSKVQIRNQQLVIGFVLFILLGLFITVVVFHSRYQQNQKLNVQLSIKNKEIEEQQTKLGKLNIDLKEANDTKDKFFSIVAHDLKNPFNALLVLTGLLLDDYDKFTEDERKQFIYQIKTSSENTFTLLQNLLDWASTQTGKTILVKEKVDISKISHETVSLVTPAAKNKEIQIVNDIPDDTFAYADKNMVSTVLLNLVSNAIKFTPVNGKVELHTLHKNHHVEIKVADSGIGISKENQDKLFRLDHKFQREGTSKEKGTGLGLILCKEFVEKNNGEIWVESTEGKGSDFNFSLPIPE